MQPLIKKIKENGLLINIHLLAHRQGRSTPIPQAKFLSDVETPANGHDNLGSSKSLPRQRFDVAKIWKPMFNDSLKSILHIYAYKDLIHF